MSSADDFDTETVLLFSEHGRLLLTRDQGEPIREKLMRLLDQHEKVTVDLDGVEAYTPSFMDEVLGKCLEAIGPDQFRRRVRPKASSPEVRKLANLVLSNRSARRSLRAQK
jgi:hypothetical protein